MSHAMSMWEYDMAAKVRAASKGFYTVAPDERENGEAMVMVNLSKDSFSQVIAKHDADIRKSYREWSMAVLDLGNVELRWFYSYQTTAPLVQTRKYDS